MHKFIYYLWRTLRSVPSKHFTSVNIEIVTFVLFNCELWFWQVSSSRVAYAALSVL